MYLIEKFWFPVGQYRVVYSWDIGIMSFGTEWFRIVVHHPHPMQYFKLIWLLNFHIFPRRWRRWILISTSSNDDGSCICSGGVIEPPMVSYFPLQSRLTSVFLPYLFQFALGLLRWTWPRLMLHYWPKNKDEAVTYICI